MIRDAFRVAAFRHSMDFIRHDKLSLLDDLEVADDVDCSLRSYQGEFVEVLVFEELVLDLDDALLSEEFAGEVDAYRDLVLYSLEVEDVECLVYVFSGYVVQNGTIFQCAYY